MHFRLLGSAFFAAFLLPHSANAQGTWPEGCKLVRMANLPLTFKGGHPIVPAHVNGKDMTFMVDTGGFSSSLARTAVTALGLVSHRTDAVVIRDVGGKVADEYV